MREKVIHTTRLYFESHVTIEPVFDERLEKVAELARGHGFRVADLLMQKRKADTPQRSRNDTFCTGHSHDWEDIESRTRRLIFDLQVNELKVWRYKIENTIVDSRHEDEWGVL